MSHRASNGADAPPPLVMVVDDNPDSRLMLQRLVLKLGYRACMAEDGQAALSLVQGELPDAVLLDVCMPGIDGLEVCRRLRAEPRTAALPIVLVTSECDLASRLEGFAAGADDHVAKPFEARELAARLRAHLELAAERAQLAELRGVLATIRLISHEFNNPLMGVVGGLDLLRMARAGEGVDEEEAVAMISDATERLTELARRLVTLSEPSFKVSPIGEMLDIEASAYEGDGLVGRPA